MTNIKYILLRASGERWFIVGEYTDPVELASAAYTLGVTKQRIRIDRVGEIEL